VCSSDLFKANKIVALLAATGVILGACYMLWLYKRVWFSEIKNQHVEHVSDLNFIELFSLGGMALLVIFLGLLPNYTLNFFSLATANLTRIFQ
jgi:NADH-quinone oxidoreductase subunit M